ncbi:MAG: flavodoxin-dependent (E)-4-hydroxy-3-methylbut-2-enyl-diphosphate synthase [Clostridiales bacterium]|jgi:(E)-4-hydroxy-3-methylbut-2-enyl-diphosphate synthase|nr:flavodoxin-dependent (E)-4-hydroxy-3-methylbut-2-enyl-diphosphate synthase [Clostridiales bacterium]
MTADSIKRFTREKTRPVRAGGLRIGGGAPVSVQSMTNTDTRNIPETVRQINALQAAGCQLARLAVPDGEAAGAFGEIKKQTGIPLSADVHFDYRLALAAIKNGADKLRINPGNLGGEDKAREVALAAKAAGIPIRVGVNAGSLEKDILRKYGGPTAEALCESALKYISLLEKNNFYDIVVSVKASDVPLMVSACLLLAEKTDCPQHIGVTEAGTPYRGSVRSAAGIGTLLYAGVGDTVRVSLTGDPVREVICAKEILRAMGLLSFGASVISCPTCGRTEIDIAALAEKIEAFCDTITAPVKVAVMGCAVNGPGEAREADYGVSGGRGTGVLFKKGKVVKKVPEECLADALIEMVRSDLNL